MINLDDFREEYGEAIDAANEFARRSRKGIPADRWASTTQLAEVAKGIRAMQQIINMQREANEAFLADMIAAGEQSMSLGEPRPVKETAES